MFFDISNGTRVNMEDTNITELTITSLQPDNNYTVFVVAYGGDLPSEHSNTVVIPQGKYITLSVFLLMFIKQLYLLK